MFPVGFTVGRLCGYALETEVLFCILYLGFY